jgi:geranylgeranyl diphosphate synthase type II
VVLRVAFERWVREPAGTDAGLVLRKVQVLQTIGDAARTTGLVGGQAIDLQAAGQASGYPMTLDGDGLRAMHAKKTGAIIRASAVSGAIMAFATDDLVHAIDGYAADLGLAFQIVDDILDVEGVRTTGRPPGRTSLRQSRLPALFGLDRSRALTPTVARAKQTLSDAGLTEEVARTYRGLV